MNRKQLFLLCYGFLNKSKEEKYEQNEAGMGQSIIFCNDTDHQYTWCNGMDQWDDTERYLRPESVKLTD